MTSQATGQAVAQQATKAAKRMIIFGGNGYVGSNVAKTALGRGWDVVIACRSGAPVVNEPWCDSVSFVAIDALDRKDMYQFLEDFGTPETTSIVNCIGLLTLDHAAARRTNAEPMRNIAAAIYEKKMPNLQHCVYISANPMMPANLVLRGYYDGKQSAERSLMGDKGIGSPSLANTGVNYTILRPSFVYGWRTVNERLRLPLGAAGWPLDLALSPMANVIPFMKDSVLAPPVSVEAVAGAVVASCEAPMDARFKNAVLGVADIKAANEALLKGL